MMKLIIAVYAHIKEEKDCLPKKLQKKKPFCNNIKRKLVKLVLGFAQALRMIVAVIVEERN